MNEMSGRKGTCGDSVWCGSGVFILILLILGGSKGAYCDDHAESRFVVAAVQPHIDESLYRSFEAFEQGIESLAGPNFDGDGVVDLVVFPEYLGVFLAVVPYMRSISDAADFVEAFGVISEERRIESLYELFKRESSGVARVMDRVFGSLAHRLGAVVIGGSYFHWDPVRRTLTNRAVVYDQKGRRLYAQDKVFLTDFERHIVGLDAGEFEDARLFRVGGMDLALTLCRDTYYREWEERFTEADLWIDIKANGEVYDRDQEESFARALPARISATGVPYGLTACLTGSFLDLFWEGPTSLVASDGTGGYRRLAAVPSPRSAGILIVEVPPVFESETPRTGKASE
jgi:predicted amidohydrolase